MANQEELVVGKREALEDDEDMKLSEKWCACVLVGGYKAEENGLNGECTGKKNTIERRFKEMGGRVMWMGVWGERERRKTLVSEMLTGFRRYSCCKW